MEANGKNFRNTVAALGLSNDEIAETRRNAREIVSAIVTAYAGRKAESINAAKTPSRPQTGLVYGRIQSGKTRAMIASTAMAFDNKFRIAIVIPEGLRKSILFFLVSAAAAIRTLGTRDRGYSYLCHPSLKNDEQAIAREEFKSPELTERQLERVGKKGTPIGLPVAIALVKPIKTRSKNIWRDNTIAEVIRKVASKYSNRVSLHFRTAGRTVEARGFLETGTLSGPELAAARNAPMPTLWIMAVTTMAGSPVGRGLKFVYPTLVVPKRFPKLFMYNRGK